MSLLKAVMQRLGKMVCLFTTPSTQVTNSALRSANKPPVKSGLVCQDVQEQSQSVAQKSKRKPKVAQLTIVEASPKRTRKLAPKDNGRDGLLLQIPAHSTPQPAKQAAKRKPKAAQSTKADLLSVPGIAVVLTPTVVQSGVRGKRKTTASKTHQPVAQAQTPKRKAAVSTTAAKKRIKSKTPAQTHTARQSKARGS